MKKYLHVVLAIFFSFVFLSSKAQMRQMYLDNDPDNQINKLSFYSASQGYVAFQKWIGYTQDSGRTFSRKFINYGNVDYGNYQVNLTFGFAINGVHAFNKDSILVYGHYGFVPAILFSVDQGNSFKLVFHSSYSNEVKLDDGIKGIEFPEKNKTGYAIDAYRILKTVNGGLSWTVLKNESASTLQFLNNNAGFVIGEDKILKTVSAGASWVSMAVPAGEIRSAFFVSENKGWLNTYEDGKGKVYYTTNGGISWQYMSNKAATSNSFFKMHFTNDSTGYGLSHFLNVYKTTDGKEWELIQRDYNYEYLNSHNDLFFINNNQFWAGGGHGYLGMSVNSGGFTLPDSRFEADVSSLNVDNNVKLKNLSKEGYAYKWFKNSVLLATTYNSSYISNRQSIDTIKLVVIKGNLSDTAIEIVDTRENQEPCSSVFSYVVDTSVVKFTSSYHAYGVKHYWKFADGAIDSTNANAEHVYTRSGFYDVEHLVVNTIDGCRDSSVQTVYIGRLRNCLLVDITFSADEFYTNLLTFDFVYKPGTENTGASSITWDYGDGTITSDYKHTFDSSKFYTVKLTLTHSATGCVTSIVKPVFVFMEDSCNANFKGYAFRDPSGFNLGAGAVRFYGKPNASGDAVTNTWIFDNKDTVRAGNTPYVEKQLFKIGYYGDNFNDAYTTCSNETVEYDIAALALRVKHIVSNSAKACTDEDSTVFELPVAKKVYIRPVPDPGFPNLVTFYAYEYGTYGVDSSSYYSRWRIDNGYGGGWLGPGATSSWREFFPDDRNHNVAVASLSCNGGQRDVYYINYAAPALPECAIYPPDFNYTLDAVEPSIVTFTTSSTASSINKTIGWTRTYYFGTGDSSSAEIVSYKYPGPGVYNVTLRYTNSSGCIKEVAKQIVIASTCNVIAAFIATQSTGNTLAFTFHNNSKPDTTTVTYKWYFGDGDSSIAKNPVYTYLTAGTYKVRLIASRSTTCFNVKDTTIVITPLCNLIAKFTLSRGNTTPDLITFTNQTIPDTSGNNYKWYFGTEDSSIAKNPVYQFSRPGTYKVRLIAKRGNCSSGKDSSIIISYKGVSITSFSPQSGAIGTRVTITGNNFSSNPSNNVVYFGAVKAVVYAASPNALSVIVPIGSTYQPITVTVNSSTAYSNKPFNVTFTGGGSPFSETSFDSKTDIVTGVYPYASSISDLDGDGKADLVVVSIQESSISAFKNIGSSGTISFASKIDFNTAFPPVAVAIGDLNGDGKPDLAVACESGVVSTFINKSTNGTIAFASKVDFAIVNGANGIAIDDLDGDGKPDIVTVGGNGNSISILKNTSSGTLNFSQMDLDAGSNPNGVAIGDLDGDTKPEIFITNARENALSVFRNTSIVGHVSFEAREVFPVGNNPKHIAVGDVDGDNKLDLIVANASDNSVSILINHSTPGNIDFAGRTDNSVGAGPVSISISDLNGDGKPDIATANRNSNLFSVLGNSTTAALLMDNSFDYETNDAPNSISIGDLDGDGMPDVAIVNGGLGIGKTVSLYRNTFVPTVDPGKCILQANFNLTRSPLLNGKVQFTNLTFPDSVSTRYKWYFGNGDSSVLKNPEATFRSAGSYRVTLIATLDSCTSTKDTLIVIDDPTCSLKATFLFSGSTIAPAGINFFNQTTPDSSNTYKWYFGNGDSSTLKNPYYTYTAPGTYYVSLISTRGACTSNFKDTLVITAPPIVCNIDATFTYSGSTTAPASITFANQTTPDSATAYKWYFGNGDSSSLKNPTFTYTTPGTYYVSLISTRGACTGNFRDTLVITAPTVVCNIDARFTHTGSTTAPAAITFSNQTTPDSATAYKWYFGNGDSSSLKNPSYIYNAPGTYFVSLIATKGTCSSTVVKALQITAPPVTCGMNAKFAYSGSTTAPATITFNNQTTPDSATAYKWYFGNGDSSSLKNPSHIYSTAGTYYVRLIASRGTCTSTFNDTIQITAPPSLCNVSAKFTHTGSTTAPATITFNNQTTPDSATAYKWYFGNGDSSSLKNPSHIYSTAGTYYVRLIASRGTCTSTFNDTIQITAPPSLCNVSAKFNYSGSTTAPATITFNNQTTPDSSTTYKWYFGDADSSSLKNPSHIYSSAGTYYIRLIATRGTCTSTFRDTLQITAPPVICNISAKFSHTGSTIAPATITFNNQTTPDSTTAYKWYFGDADSSSLKNPSHIYSTAGTYYIRLIATRGTCTSTFRDTLQITAPTVVCNISAKFTYTGITTNPAVITFSNQTISSTINTKYTWYFGNGDSSTERNPIYTYSNPGTYNVRLTAFENTGCKSVKDTTIIISNNCTVDPGFSFSADSTQSNRITFINETVPALASMKYYWRLGDGYRDSSQNPQHIYPQAGNFNVCLQAIQSTACTKTICKTIAVTLPAGRFNATPNPAQSSINLYLFVERGYTFIIRFTNSAGFVVKEVKYPAVPGANNLHLNISDLPSGYYHITAESNADKLHTQILKL